MLTIGVRGVNSSLIPTFLFLLFPPLFPAQGRMRRRFGWMRMMPQGVPRGALLMKLGAAEPIGRYMTVHPPTRAGRNYPRSWDG